MWPPTGGCGCLLSTPHPDHPYLSKVASTEAAFFFAKSAAFSSDPSSVFKDFLSFELAFDAVVFDRAVVFFVVVFAGARRVRFGVSGVSSALAFASADFAVFVPAFLVVAVVLRVRLGFSSPSAAVLDAFLGALF